MIDHLIVIAGPRAVGKTTILNKIHKQDSVLNKYFNISSENEWKLMGLNYIDKNPNLKFTNLVLHYDFFRPIMRNLKGYKNDSLDQLIQNSTKTDIITLWAPKNELISRIQARIKNKVLPEFEKDKNNPRLKLKLTKLQQILTIYQSCGRLDGLYETWLQYTFKEELNNWSLGNSNTFEKLDRINNIFDFFKIKLNN